jgi:hypothetical protein
MLNKSLFYVDEYFGLFYVANTLDASFGDRSITGLLNMDLEDYRQHLISNFNGIHASFDYDIYFKHFIDAENALEWVESIYVLVTLQSASI